MVKIRFTAGVVLISCAECKKEEKLIQAGPAVDIMTIDYAISNETVAVSLGLQFDAFARWHKTCAMPVTTRIGDRESFH